MRPDLDAIRAEVEAMASEARASAGAGERASARRLAGRLREAGAAEVAVEPFRYQGTYGHAHALHAAAGMVAARLGGVRGALLGLGALASLELEASGRRQWIRRLLPAGEGATVVARLPARGEPRSTLVLVAHHDAARTGLVWHPAIAETGDARRLRRRNVDGFMWPTAAGLALASAPWRPLRAAGATLCALSIAADLDVARGATVPGASDNATGVAVVVDLVRALAADPPDGLETIAVLPGCEESGMGGMAAFLRSRGASLDPARTLVLGLDTLGAGTPIVAAAEGTILTHRYARADLSLAEAGALRVGHPAPQRWRIGGWTDPILARFAGLRAISLLSISPRGTFTNYHRPTDTADRVDWGSVGACAEIASGIAAEWADRAGEAGPTGPRAGGDRRRA